MSVILKMAQVESIDDFASAGRIKVRLVEDGQKPNSELDFAFPLLPKTLQTFPKVGECVLVISSVLNDNTSNKYYIGPIISQPQDMAYAPYAYNKGRATSALKGGSVELKETIENFSDTNGSFPEKDSVSLVGRYSEDIILKDKEIDIRCGIRGSAINYPDLDGTVVFNKKNPSYIQLRNKYGRGHINIVSDEVNIVSHNAQFNDNVSLTDQKDLITKESYDSMVKQLHQVPYGDVLVEYLDILRGALINHVHPWAQLPPCDALGITEANGLDFNKLLSNTLRIS